MSTAILSDFVHSTITFSRVDFKYLPALFAYCDEAQPKHQASKRKTTVAAMKKHRLVKAGKDLEDHQV